ncbi:Na(+)/H(+) antiporter subunit B [Mangrovibacillus cuniculi]|uniref:Na(+)/H(+) antiporter subunit B n=1 Tax=Mangrovibacillus cuniculi TaxID=2593652 RepID=A0A7S8HGA8_9BACI|nr:Na(+)/H(+) antiporter subunit B [Mangrovibacillus cuniculi]QPC47346.1 Na(+)/H(+) antiporter subunit B [Mangrovibacillus cuniculi]
MKKRKPNDLVLQTVTKVVSFLIILFSIRMFFAGHYEPGGGFIGALMTSAALVLLLLAYDAKTLSTILPIDYKIITAIGLVFAIGTGVGGVLFDVPFLTHAYDKFYLPLLGEQTLHSALIFDLGVYLGVIGVTLTIIKTIGESE